MNRYIYYILCFSLLFVACRKDDFKETILQQTPTVEDMFTRGDVAGLVVDENGAGLADAQLALDGESTTTDINGYFKFTDIELSGAGGLLRIAKGDYFDNYKFVYTNEGTQSYSRITMVGIKETGRFQSSDGKTITEASGASISFPANAIAKGGTSYSGDVIVRSHWYDPSSRDLIASMPGDLRAIDKNDEVVQLATLGMMAVELSAPDGSELQLAEGMVATLTFPLTPEMASEVNGDIPLWSLNESTGVWEEEGVATLVGESMVGEVSHFSFWNCDVPYPIVEITGKLESSSGEPIPNYPVTIWVRNSFLGAGGTTDSDGVFQGKVPKDVPLELIVMHCDQPVVSEDIGILSGDQDLGAFTVNFTDFEKLVTGRLVDCMMQPLVDAYVLVGNGSLTDVLVPDADGYISGYVAGCGSDEITLKAYNPSAIFESDLVVVENNNDDLAMGDWAVCEELVERITYSINGGPNNLFADARVSLVDNELLHIYAKDDNTGFTFDTQVNLSSTGTASPFVARIEGIAQNSQQGGGDCWNYRDSGTVCEDLEITITDMGAVGDWVSGTMKGMIPRDSVGVNLSEIDATFELILDEAFDTGMVEGKVWHDENGNGLQDSGEAPISGQFISIQGSSLQTTRLYPYDSFYAPTDTDGNYTRRGLVPGEYYQVAYTQFYYNISPANQGDNMIDSDFVLATGSSNYYIYEIQEFTDSGLEDNVDLGLIPVDVLCNVFTAGCGPDAILRVNPTGGVPPYEITLNGMTTLPPGENIFNNISPGEHTVTVADQTGLMGSQEVTVYEFQNHINVQVWEDLIDGVPDVWDEPTANSSNWSVVLKLYNNGSLVQTANTDFNGRTYFRNLEPGNYSITMDLPSSFEFVQMGIGSDENRDSDMDPTTNFTEEKMFIGNCNGIENLTIGMRKL